MTHTLYDIDMNMLMTFKKLYIICYIRSWIRSSDVIYMLY